MIDKASERSILLHILLIVVSMSAMTGLCGFFIGAYLSRDKDPIKYIRPQYVHIYTEDKKDVSFSVNYKTGGDIIESVTLYDDSVLVEVEDGTYTYKNYRGIEVMRGVDEQYEINQKY